jgi:hypothetical protein
MVASWILFQIEPWVITWFENYLGIIAKTKITTLFVKKQAQALTRKDPWVQQMDIEQLFEVKRPIKHIKMWPNKKEQWEMMHMA